MTGRSDERLVAAFRRNLITACGGKRRISPMQRVVVDLACEAKRGHLRATDENLRNRLRREVLALMRAAVSNVFARRTGGPRVPTLDDLRARSGRPAAVRKRP